MRVRWFFVKFESIWYFYRDCHIELPYLVTMIRTMASGLYVKVVIPDAAVDPEYGSKISYLHT